MTAVAESAHVDRSRQPRLLVRQGNEFVAVVGRQVEKAMAPVGLAPLLLGRLDPLAARGDEIPPDVAGARKGRAAEHDEPCAGRASRDADAVARAKHHHPAGVERLARDRDRALDDIEPAILVILRQGSAGARLQRRVGVERVGKDGDGRFFAKGAAEDQPKAYALGFDDRQRLLAVVLEAGRGLLLSFRQGDPRLNSQYAVATLSRFGGCPLGMGDAAPRHHPVDVAGTDDLIGAEAVPMLELAAKEIADRRKPDVRMRAQVDALAADELGRPHLIEENERADQPPVRRGKRAAHLEAADVARTRNDQRFDRVDADRVRESGLERRVPTHEGLLVPFPRRIVAVHLREKPALFSGPSQLAGRNRLSLSVARTAWVNSRRYGTGSDRASSSDRR